MLRSCVSEMVGVMQRDVVDAPTRQLARSITFPLRGLVATGQGDFLYGNNQAHCLNLLFISLVSLIILNFVF
jgi:hypothetical protein